MKNLRIGHYLRLNRERRDFTQADVARVLNYSQQTIAKWENSVSTPDANVLLRLADLYRVSLDDLLGHMLVKETEAPYYTKKDVTEEWINSLGFKTVFEFGELDAKQMEHLSKQIIDLILFIRPRLIIKDSEQ